MLTVAAPEGGQVDGVFVDAPPDMRIPSTRKDPDAAWRWVSAHTNHPQVRFLGFDVKYFSLMPGGLKEMDYAYVNPPSERRTENTSVYIVVFESIPDFVALVPKGSFDLSTDFAYGIQPLLNKCPAWCHPFMVHERHLAQAVRSLVRAKKGSWYWNPTLKYSMTGYLPRLTREPPIWPTEPRMASSLKHMRESWSKLQRHGCRAYLNPVQPLWCDFLLRKPPFPLPLRIEFKLMERSKPFELGKRSPFAPGRQWHALICMFREGKGYLCFIRDEVDEVSGAWSWEQRLR